MKSKLGLIFAGVYILVAGYLITTQGLFGESFIALILGLPWSMLMAYFEFGGVAGPFLYVLIFTPLILNALILYWVGSKVERISSRT
jgi:hypothetical protein